MAHVTGWRPRGADVIYVCDTCGVVVPPDRDGCPNAPDFVEVMRSGGEQTTADLHRLTRFVREDVAERERAGLVAERTVQRVALGSVEAAIACLEAAKVGLQR